MTRAETISDCFVRIMSILARGIVVECCASRKLVCEFENERGSEVRGGGNFTVILWMGGC